MPDYPLYPVSQIAAFEEAEQYEVSAEVIADIAEEARQAFYRSVRDRLTDLYPDSETTGDIDPFADHAGNKTAVEWVERYAWNNSAVAAYNEQPCKFVTSEVYNPDSLMLDWEDGITSVDIARGPDFPGLVATVRGTRSAIYDFVLRNWDGTDDLDEWADRQITPDTDQTGTENS